MYSHNAKLQILSYFIVRFPYILGCSTLLYLTFDADPITLCDLRYEPHKENKLSWYGPVIQDSNFTTGGTLLAESQQSPSGPSQPSFTYLYYYYAIRSTCMITCLFSRLNHTQCHAFKINHSNLHSIKHFLYQTYTFSNITHKSLIIILSFQFISKYLSFNLYFTLYKEFNKINYPYIFQII